MRSTIRAEGRAIRHRRIRRRVRGTSARPRLTVFRSLRHIHAQLVDDDRGITLAAVGSLAAEFRERLTTGGNVEGAKAVGELIARKARDLGITQVVFDRGGYQYHGRVKALADAARAQGLVF